MEKNQVINLCIAVAGWNLRKEKLRLKGKFVECGRCEKVIELMIEKLKGVLDGERLDSKEVKKEIYKTLKEEVN
jgi:hypothetical protein